MSKAVWKYPIPLRAAISILMPAGAQVLSLQLQHDEPVLWALVDTDTEEPPEEREFYLVGTGHPIPNCAGHHIGTFQLHGLVFHLFEVPDAPKTS